MFEEHLDGRENNAKELWKMIILELWLRMQIDEDKQQNKRRLAMHNSISKEMNLRAI
jgi:hypothetical protein